MLYEQLKKIGYVYQSTAESLESQSKKASLKV